MSIPNTLTKLINRKNELIKFDISKISSAICRAIIDVEKCVQWIAEKRARKYADKIQKIIYKEFYDINYIFSLFMKKYLSFKIEERFKRLENAYLTERLAVIYYEQYSEISTETNFERNKLKIFLIEQIDAIVKNQFQNIEINCEEIAEIILSSLKKFYCQKNDLKYFFPTTSFVLDLVERELKNFGEVELAEGFMIFREGENKIRNSEIKLSQFTNDGFHPEICRKTTEWNINNDCENIFALNEWVYGKNGKSIEKLIELSEKRYYNDVGNIAKKIIQRINDIKIIIVAGPSSSNKTTTTLIIKNELNKLGYKLKELNVDDYYKNIEEQPKDEFGDFDFEMPESIDMALLNKHLTELVEGKTIQKPHFNFKLEKRDSYSPFKLEKDEVLLIDCLHGLYRSMTSTVASNKKFKIYIEAMNILKNTDGAYTRWTDIRLLRRMIRDLQFRGYKPEDTLAHWPYVRKGELKHIIPYIFSTDAVINSGLPYELCALKTALKTKFPKKEFFEKLRLQERLDPYIRGIRIYNLLETVAELPSLDLVPKNSPLREFLGGSEYTIAHNE